MALEQTAEEALKRMADRVEEGIREAELLSRELEAARSQIRNLELEVERLRVRGDVASARGPGRP